MDILYAPWRDKYVVGSNKESCASDSICIFCKMLVSDDVDHQNFVLKKTQHAFVILNLYPYNGGHLLVLPRQHAARLEDVSKEIRTELMELMSASIVILKDVLRADGINTGLNLGKASGGSVPDHLHFHIVPRWFGDTGFTVTTADTKSVSVDLERIYNDLKPAFEALEI
ncbi:MAG: HIT domain-containing protein [Candidatus Chromulinivorax sp.]|nr:HIT domain-containing protein [Candidatus Chromulinivorax sp.]